MLAPRKTLWSTPLEVVREAAGVIPLRNTGETVVDVGCGNGTVLMEWAKCFVETHHTDTATVSFIGIDIENDRIDEARGNWERLCSELPGMDRIVDMKFYCANALESLDLWTDQVTILYLYLIPRGLRRMAPFIIGSCEHLRAIVSFMNPIQHDLNTANYAMERRRVAVSDDTMWPLYIYQRIDQSSS